ncbi:hypothetical protein DDB_G0273341 [Dictyostelium discoideum AX4]|uniref:Uncharacterized protein n=1 Tax=Dictyostelium discoideum TaxID=44689 RepID=Q556V4_DICDI|nr:hypothetical protein DDB_G0273797 [Dictyostelium discoideum AX4]XP_644735.1 hypothetical protein DDB_G0273341 [Dictyostelium discoideum AX4]EAL70589.1 hypothetical protein DDB_G0273797 [Dictyostelium discoideum AX4]EAL70888.1 hypothetical protein DDB_G0273341 [Dictyostelium discoideum AX4]|eukprot:XP_644515.1 hypothetical protein DDB_G0273797 [Dictyostelium discoideum AX4]
MSTTSNGNDNPEADITQNLEINANQPRQKTNDIVNQFPTYTPSLQHQPHKLF